DVDLAGLGGAVLDRGVQVDLIAGREEARDGVLVLRQVRGVRAVGRVLVYCEARDGVLERLRLVPDIDRDGGGPLARGAAGVDRAGADVVRRAGRASRVPGVR